MISAERESMCTVNTAPEESGGRVEVSARMIKNRQCQSGGEADLRKCEAYVSLLFCKGGKKGSN